MSRLRLGHGKHSPAMERSRRDAGAVWSKASSVIDSFDHTAKMVWSKVTIFLCQTISTIK